MTEKKASIF